MVASIYVEGDVSNPLVCVMSIMVSRPTSATAASLTMLFVHLAQQPFLGPTNEWRQLVISNGCTPSRLGLRGSK